MTNQADSQLAAIGRLDALFESNGIDYWLFGGWAVDLHAGRVTRDHEDIDVAVWQTDLQSVRGLLVADGWTDTTPVESDGYESYSNDGIRLDVAFLARDRHGIVYTPLRGGRGEWPLDSFAADVRDLAGVRAHVVTRASLIADKSELREDAATAGKDAADARVLRS